MIARPYQQKAIDDIKGLLGEGKKRVLCQMPTGSGKTFVFSTILKGAHAKGNPCIMVVNSKALVDQASHRLNAMGIPHGVMMANDKRADVSQPIQVVSIDTCHRRNHYPSAKIVVVDEAHTAVSPKFKKFLSHYEDSFWISVTATPWVDSGLQHLATDVVYPISFNDLTKQGYLVPAKYFVPTKFDTSDIELKGGDYEENSVISAFDKQAVYGDVVANYKKHCQGECTWVYGVSIAHANKIKESFDAAGIRSIVITGEDTLEERKTAIENEDLIISVGTLTTGVDLPRLRNIILCRPTRSKNLYIQILGRGTRPHEGKTHFKVFDHVGCVSEHGFIECESKSDLKAKTKKEKKQSEAATKASVKICPSCLAACSAKDDICPECQTKFIKKPFVLPNKRGDLIEIGLTMEDKFRHSAKRHLDYIWKYNSKIGALYYRLLEDFGDEIYKEYEHIDYEFRALYLKWTTGEEKNFLPKGWGKWNGYY